MKKLLSIFLVMVLIFSFVACTKTERTEGNKKDAVETLDPKTQTNKKNSEELATETAKSFLDAIIHFDSDALKKYSVTEAEIPAALSGFDPDTMLDKIIGGMPAEFSAYSTYFEEIITSMFEQMKKKFTYTIKETAKDGKEKYVFTVEMTIPDVNSVDFDAIMADKLNETTISNLALKLMESGTITETTTEQEIINLLMPEVLAIIKTTVSEAEFETISEEKEIVVVKTAEGNWLVDPAASTLD